jgi:ankyrin repeat protein
MDQSARPSEGDAPLLAAVRAGDLEAARTALGTGASPNAIAIADETEKHGPRSRTPALYSAVRRGDAPMVELLLKSGADPDAAFERQSIDHETIPCLVAALPHHGIAAMLLQAGADPNLPSTWGEDRTTYTFPLAHAQGNVELEKLLKSYGATDVTQAMLNAGSQAFWRHDNKYETAEALVRRIFLAMVRAGLKGTS